MKYIAAIIFLLIQVPLVCQENDTGITRKKPYSISFSVSPEITTVYGNIMYTNGINIEAYIAERTGILWRFAYGSTNTNELIHINAGMWLGYNIIKEGSEEDESAEDWIAKALLFILPEGICYHVPLSNGNELVPYINLGGIEFYNDEKYWSIDGGAGLRYYLDEHAFFSPYLGFKYSFYNDRFGLNAGASLGIRF